MKVLVLVISMLSLSGCAAYFDAQDPCQREPYPSFCGAGMSSTYIINGTTYNIRKVK